MQTTCIFERSFIHKPELIQVLFWFGFVGLVLTVLSGTLHASWLSDGLEKVEIVSFQSIPENPQPGDSISLRILLKNTGETRISGTTLEIPYRIRAMSLLSEVTSTHTHQIQSLGPEKTLEIVLPNLVQDSPNGNYFAKIGPVSFHPPLRGNGNLILNTKEISFTVIHRSASISSRNLEAERTRYKKVEELRSRAQAKVKNNTPLEAAKMYDEILTLVDVIPGRLNPYTIEILSEATELSYRYKLKNGVKRGKDLVGRLTEKNGENDESLLPPLRNLGRFIAKTVSEVQAIPYLQRALTISKQNKMEADLDTHMLYYDFITTLENKGDVNKAEMLCREQAEAIETAANRKERVSGESFFLATNALDRVCRAKNQSTDKHPLTKKLFTLKARSTSGKSYARSLLRQSEQSSNVPDYQAAVSLSIKALATARIAFEDDQLALVPFLKQQAVCEEGLGSYQKAKVLLEEAILILRAHPHTAQLLRLTITLDSLAKLCINHLNNLKEAEKLILESVHIQEERTRRGLDPVRLAAKYYDLAKLYILQKRTYEAAHFLESALKEYEYYGRGESYSAKQVIADLIDVYASRGNDEDVAKYQKILDSLND